MNVVLGNVDKLLGEGLMKQLAINLLRSGCDCDYLHRHVLCRQVPFEIVT